MTIGLTPPFQAKTLIEHWNGTTWQRVASPNPAVLNNFLDGVVAISATDIWAVGFYFSMSHNADLTLIEQWNGTTWQVVASPNVAGLNNELDSVAAVSAHNIWAVGDSATSSTGPSQTLTEQWNGTSWQVVPSPNPGAFENYLYGLVRVPGTHQLWAVGLDNSTTSSPSQTLIEAYC